MSSLEQIDHLTLDERGAGPAVLVLHGGGGPVSVAAFVQAMAQSASVLAPTHPGFGGTPLLDGVETIADLAGLYAEVLRRRDLRDVLVVGFSVGGWIACELALLAPQRLRGLVLVNAVGIEVPSEPVADVFSLTARELAMLSWHAPDKFFVDPATLPPERASIMAANFRALKGYGALPREAERQRRGVASDPSLQARLAAVATPTLVVWGESDRVATLAYGKTLAASIPGARFERIAECGHLPQIEQPARLLDLVGGFRQPPLDRGRPV